MFGSNQRIALGAIIGPFAVSTIMVFAGKMTAAEWISFNQFLIPIVTGISLGASAYIKGKSPGASE